MWRGCASAKLNLNSDFSRRAIHWRNDLAFQMIWAFAWRMGDFMAVAQGRDSRHGNRIVCARAEAMLRGDDDPDGVPDVVKQAAWVEGEGGGL